MRHARTSIVGVVLIMLFLISCGNSKATNDGDIINDSDAPDDTANEDDGLVTPDDTVVSCTPVIKMWGGIAPYGANANGVAVDLAGNIFVVGDSDGAIDDNTVTGMNDIYLIKWAPDGIKAWSRQWGTIGYDRGSAVVADSEGNIYVTGSVSGALDGNVRTGYTDAFLTKWNADGTQAWTRQWGAALQIEEGISIAIDGEGAILIMGFTTDTGDGNTDVFLAKWSADGEMTWREQWGSAVEDNGRSVAVDQEGNIYVAGVTKGAMDGNSNMGKGDVFLTKWDAEGAKAWTRQWGENSYDEALSVAVDSKGDVLVTGFTWGLVGGDTQAGLTDIFLFKWNANGEEIWKRQWGTEGMDYARSVAIDAADNIYIAGDAEGSLDGNADMGAADLFLIKLNSDGEKQWTKQWGTDMPDVSNAISLDGVGNILVTGVIGGSFDGSPHVMTFLSKWEGEGVLGWSREWTGYGPATDYAASLAIDNDGKVFVVGQTTGAMDGNAWAGGPFPEDAFLTTWNADGSQAWSGQWGSTNSDHAKAVALDHSGNAFVTGSAGGMLDGSTTSTGQDNLFLTRWNSDGSKGWAKQWGPGWGTAVAVDQADNIFVAGGISVALDGNDCVKDPFEDTCSGDVFLIKWNADGTKVWTKQWGTSFDDTGTSIAFDGDGNIFVVGYTSGSFNETPAAGNYNIFITKLASYGDVVWTKQWGNVSGYSEYSVALNDAGDIFIAGDTDGSFDGHANAGNRDLILIKLDGSGNTAWTKQWGTADDEYIASLAIDSDGSLFVTYNTQKMVNGNDVHGNAIQGTQAVSVTKWSADASQSWTSRLPADSLVDQAVRAVALGPDGKVFIAGYALRPGARSSSHPDETDALMVVFEPGCFSGTPDPEQPDIEQPDTEEPDIEQPEEGPEYDDSPDIDEPYPENDYEAPDNDPIDWTPGTYEIDCGPSDTGNGAEMCAVPAGEFEMGCNLAVDISCEPGYVSTEMERPYHTVMLSAYKIARYEVTVTEYNECVTAGACNNDTADKPHYATNASRREPFCNLGATGKENHPMNCVTWYGAKAYCEWAGQRLPTEAEWEKAARGTDGRKYPWGNEEPNCTYAAISDNYGSPGCTTEGTLPEGGKIAGMSPYGLYDVAGNIGELVSDWYGEDYYKVTPFNDPTGPVSGEYRILRGGSWLDSTDGFNLRTSYRERVLIDMTANRFGFRCAE